MRTLASIASADMLKGEYSRPRTLSARKAMGTALARHIASLQFAQGVQFRAVYTDWPSYEQKYVPPSAVVLPGAAGWKYEDALLTPTLLEHTVEPIDPSTGMMVGAGWGLYKLAEVTMELELTIAGSSNVQRDNLVEQIEEAFEPDEVLMDEISGPRYGIIVTMPEYYGLSCRFALLEGRVIDDEDKASREKREAVLTISAQAPHVKLAAVKPLILTVTKELL